MLPFAVLFALGSILVLENSFIFTNIFALGIRVLIATLAILIEVSADAIVIFLLS